MKKIIITSALFFIVSTTHANATTGPQVLSQVINWYNDTRSDCGGEIRPAFLCSGIMLRAVETNPAFLPWDPAPTAIANGGISFSWLRADNNFSNLVFTFQNGYIFYPSQLIPASRFRGIPILCAFPMDGDTFSRNSNGCGANNTYPQQSRPCNEVGITNANQWIAQFNTPGANRYRIQCGWNVREGQPDKSQRFRENILARDLMADNWWSIQNEMRVETWATGIGASLPIHSFFYVRDNAQALANVKFDQRRYYDLYNTVIPIIEISMPRNRTERVSFNFINSDQGIGCGLSVAQSSPVVPLARGNNNDQLRASDYYPLDELTIKIPVYNGMQAGQRIRITWRGANSPLTYTATRTVTRINDVFFTVPRPYFINAIGTHAQISYSVHDPDGNTQFSRTTDLSIAGLPMNLPKAQINLSTRKVTISYPGMNDAQIVSLHSFGPKLYDFGRQSANNSGTVTFDIPQAWINNQRGHSVYLIYAVAPGRGERFQFSKVLVANIN